MERLRSLLSPFSEIKILDVATGSGAFLETISNFIPNNSKLTRIGIDQNEKYIEAARTKFDSNLFTFEVMDSHHLTFPDQSFDLVCISNSMHHMKSPQLVLAEMIRVLKPNGLLIVFEMIHDNQSERQMTHVLMHHFWAEIDTAFGITHRPTYTREELSQLIAVNKSVTVLNKWEIEDTESSCEPEDIEMLVHAVTSYYEKTKELENANDYKLKAEALLERLATIGFDSATECLWVMQKVNA